LETLNILKIIFRPKDDLPKEPNVLAFQMFQMLQKISEYCQK